MKLHQISDKRSEFRRPSAEISVSEERSDERQERP